MESRRKKFNFLARKGFQITEQPILQAVMAFSANQISNTIKGTATVNKQ